MKVPKKFKSKKLMHAYNNNTHYILGIGVGPAKKRIPVMIETVIRT